MTQKEQGASSEILASKNILIINDSPAVRKTFTDIFESTGDQVFLASNGQEAIEILQKEPRQDLIITDLIMPNIDGFEFLSTIIDHPEITTCKAFILYTNNNPAKVSRIINVLNQLAQMKNREIKIKFLPPPQN